MAAQPPLPTVAGIDYADLTLVRVQGGLDGVEYNNGALVLNRSGSGRADTMNTTHFTLNAIVENHMMGKQFDGSEVAIIAPFERAIREGNNIPSGISAGDTWIHADPSGNVRLPGARLLVPEGMETPAGLESIVTRYARGNTPEETRANRDAAIAKQFRQMNVPLKSLDGTSGIATIMWASHNYNEQVDDLQRFAQATLPGNKIAVGELHFHASDGDWERSMSKLRLRMEDYAGGQRLEADEIGTGIEHKLFSLIQRQIHEMGTFIEERIAGHADPRAIAFYQRQLNTALAEAERTVVPERKHEVAAAFGEHPYYYSEDGKPVGPVSFDELAAKGARGELKGGMIWQQGMQGWEKYEGSPEHQAISSMQIERPKVLSIQPQYTGNTSELLHIGSIAASQPEPLQQQQQLQHTPTDAQRATQEAQRKAQEAMQKARAAEASKDQDSKNVVRLVADRLSRGENVFIGDTSHANPNHFRYITDPTALAIYKAHGLTDILIEVPPQDLKFLKSLQQQDLTRDGMREAIGSRRILSATLATQAGVGSAWLDGLADLTYYSKQLGINLHGDPSIMEGEKYAMSQLPEENRIILQQFFDDKNKGLRTGENMSAEERRIYDDYLKFRTEYRSSADTHKAAQSDLDVIAAMKGKTGNGSTLGFFGSGHLIGLNDLDDLTTQLNGKRTTTIIPNEPSSQHHLQYAIDRKVGAIKAPDFISDATSGKVYSPAISITDNANERQASGWISNAQEINLKEFAELPSAVAKQMQGHVEEGVSRVPQQQQLRHMPTDEQRATQAAQLEAQQAMQKARTAPAAPVTAPPPESVVQPPHPHAANVPAEASLPKVQPKPLTSGHATRAGGAAGAAMGVMGIAGSINGTLKKAERVGGEMLRTERDAIRGDIASVAAGAADMLPKTGPLGAVAGAAVRVAPIVAAGATYLKVQAADAAQDGRRGSEAVGGFVGGMGVGMTSGAATGAVLGPWGAVIGGIVGGFGGGYVGSEIGRTSQSGDQRQRDLDNKAQYALDQSVEVIGELGRKRLRGEAWTGADKAAVKTIGGLMVEHVNRLQVLDIPATDIDGKLRQNYQLQQAQHVVDYLNGKTERLPMTSQERDAHLIPSLDALLPALNDAKLGWKPHLDTDKSGKVDRAEVLQTLQKYGVELHTLDKDGRNGVTIDELTQTLKALKVDQEGRVTPTHGAARTERAPTLNDETHENFRDTKRFVEAMAAWIPELEKAGFGKTIGHDGKITVEDLTDALKRTGIRPSDVDRDTNGNINEREAVAALKAFGLHLSEQAAVTTPNTPANESLNPRSRH